MQAIRVRLKFVKKETVRNCSLFLAPAKIFANRNLAFKNLSVMYKKITLNSFTFCLCNLFLLITISFGQPSSALQDKDQSTSKDNPRIKNFGNSLKKIAGKEDKHSTEIKKKADDETIIINTELVTRSVLVTDKSGRIISGLSKEDFIIREDGLMQEIDIFSSQQKKSIPRSIVLILDLNAHQASYLEVSIEAAKSLVDKLETNDEMAIATADLKLLSDFTNNKVSLKETLDSLEKLVANCFKTLKGNIHLSFPKPFNIKNSVCLGSGLEFDTLLAVLNEMFINKTREQIIIFQGDGNEIIWLQDDSESPYKISKSTRDNSGMKYVGSKAMRNFGYKEVKRAVERSRATIYSIVPGIRFWDVSKKEGMKRAEKSYEITLRSLGFPEYYISRSGPNFLKREFELRTAGQTAMHKTAELSGGSTYFIEKPEDAESVYSNIFTNINNRYIIGYYPTNQEQDGKLRNVKIEVKGHPEYIVTGRKTYFPQ